jgi:hypothetical protein
MQRAAKNILRHNLPSEAPLLFKRKENKQRYNLQSETQLLFRRKHKQIQLWLGSSTFVQKENKQTDPDSFCLPKLGQLEMRSHPQ